MAALVGVMFMVLVAGYTAVMHDLATAVILGVIASALGFAWQHAKHIGVDVKHNEFGSKIYQLHGPLFFASVSSFKDLFDPRNDPDDVVIDFYSIILASMISQGWKQSIHWPKDMSSSASVCT